MAKDLTAALQAMTEEAAGQTSRVDKNLPAAKVPTNIPPRTGSGNAKKGGGGGIASPLVETAFSGRQYWPTKTLTSTDGLLSWEVDPIAKVFFKDALNNDVEIDYQQPS